MQGYCRGARGCPAHPRLIPAAPSRTVASWHNIEAAGWDLAPAGCSACGMKGAGARGGMRGGQQGQRAHCSPTPLVWGGLRSSCRTSEDGQRWAKRRRNLLARFVGSVKSDWFLKMGHAELRRKTLGVSPLGQTRGCCRCSWGQDCPAPSPESLP